MADLGGLDAKISSLAQVALATPPTGVSPTPQQVEPMVEKVAQENLSQQRVEGAALRCLQEKQVPTQQGVVEIRTRECQRAVESQPPPSGEPPTELFWILWSV